MADDITRPEFDAKLEAAEARTETRIATLSGGIDLKFSQLNNKLDALIGASKEVKSETQFSRWSIIAIVVAAMAAMFATQANYIASFSAGMTAFQLKSDQAKGEPAKQESPKEPIKK